MIFWLSRPGTPALLPPAQEGHWQRVTTALSLDHLQRQCQQDGAFSRRYGSLLPQLYKRGERFVREMLPSRERLVRENRYLYGRASDGGDA